MGNNLKTFANKFKAANVVKPVKITRSETPTGFKQVPEEVGKKVGEQIFQENKTQFIGRCLKGKKTYAIGKTTTLLEISECNEEKITKLHKRTLPMKEKAKPEVYSAVEKAVENAIKAVKNAVEETKTTSMADIMSVKENTVAIMNKAVEKVKEEKAIEGTIRKEYIHEIKNKVLSESKAILLNKKTKMKKQVEYTKEVINVIEKSLAGSAIAFEEQVKKVRVVTIDSVSAVVIENVTKAVEEKVAEIAAHFAAIDEADAVIHSLIELVKLYSEPKDSWVAVKHLKNLIDFVKTDLMGSMHSVFSNACRSDSSKNDTNKNFFETCVEVLQRINRKICTIEALFRKHENGLMRLDEINLFNLFTAMKVVMSGFIAGIANLQRLVDNVEKQPNSEKLTCAQLDSFRGCLVKLLKAIASLVSSEEFKQGAVDLYKDMVNMELKEI